MSGLETFFLEGALNWENMVLAVGGILFTLALVPTLKNPKSAVPWNSSLLTAAVLTAYLTVYAALGFWFSFVAGASTALIWWLLLLFRRVPPTKMERVECESSP